MYKIVGKRDEEGCMINVVLTIARRGLALVLIAAAFPPTGLQRYAYYEWSFRTS